MPATSFYAEAAYETQQSSQMFDPDLTIDDTELPVDDLEELEMAAQDPASCAVSANRRSTDLVRLYLQEIGRVRLLGRDEEVSEAQKVQRYLRMRIVLSNAAKQGDEILIPYLRVIEVQERLASELGHRPSIERWASAAGVEVLELKQILGQGKRR
ncbi:RNA polymerase sigma factor, RpoD/SigA family, partial [Fischerella thermalis WC442]